MAQWNPISNLTGRGSNRLPYWLAIILLLALGVQTARLLYALTNGSGQFGRPVQSGLPASADKAAMAHDPFGSATNASAASGVVTALPLRLFGTRIDFATGRGSAIIATPDGVQQSFLVGETIMPGAKLAAVAGDHVEIERSGARERLYLDQSVPAPVAAAPVSAMSAPAPQPAAPAPATQTPSAPPVTEVQQSSSNSASEQPQP